MELTRTPEDWLPKGGKKWKDGNKQTYTATIIPSGIKGKLKFTLQKVTNYKGYCSNAGKKTDKDLRFKPNQSGFKYNSDGSVETTEEVNSATIIVQCKDYGAYGRIRAEAITIEEKAMNIVAKIKYKKGDEEIIHEYATIPRDEDDDKMADSWEKPYRDINDIVGDLSPYWDGDYAYNNPKKDKHNPPVGDGIKTIDEYRGFKINGKFKRTNPTIKEIFVYLGKRMYKYNVPGIGLINIKPNTSNIQNLGYEVYYIKKGESRKNRLLNFNSVIAPSQRAIWVRNRTLWKGYYGACLDNTGKKIGVGTPWIYGNIFIDARKIAKTLKKYRPKAKLGLYIITFENFCDHEIGHSLFLNHHTDWWHGKCLMHTGNVGSNEIDFEYFIGRRKSGFCKSYSHGDKPCRLKTKIK